MSTGSGDQEILPSVYSSSEHESSDEELEEQPSEEDAASTPTRTIQVVATAPRPRRGSGDSSDEDGDQDEAKSKSEDEGEAARATADGPARGRSYLQSIRARKPKKKVYAKPKGETAIYNYCIKEKYSRWNQSHTYNCMWLYRACYDNVLDCSKINAWSYSTPDIILQMNKELMQQANGAGTIQVYVQHVQSFMKWWVYLCLCCNIRAISQGCAVCLLPREGWSLAL